MSIDNRAQEPSRHVASTRPVVTRFAPSPTGHLHIGGVRTALFCYAYARRFGGSFLLRIEDTDQARSSESSTRGILEDLAWCGIYWDQGPELVVKGQKVGGDPRSVGPFHQSQRLSIYNRVLADMLERDLAYPAFDSAADMDAMRKAAAARKDTFRYKRSNEYDRAAALARMNAGEPCVVRFNNPGNVVRVSDEVLGEIKFEPEHTDDFVLRKADGFPTYHFAVVVDDELMNVTHILRGQEHLNNTPRHVALQLALGYVRPTYAHLPLIFNPDSTKMSKRDKDKAAREAVKKLGGSLAALGPDVLGPPALGTNPLGDVTPEQFQQWLDDKTRQLPSDTLRAVAERARVTLPEIDVDDFRRSGYLPEVLCNYLALLGWNPGLKTPDGKDLEKFDIDFLSRQFDFDRIGRTNSKFDRVKLASFNQDAIAPPPVGAMSLEVFAARWRAWCETFAPELLSRFASADGDARFSVLASAVRARAKTFRECVAASAFMCIDDELVVYDAKATERSVRQPLAEPKQAFTGRDLLKAALATLGAIDADTFSPVTIHAAIEQCSTSLGMPLGPMSQALRVAVTGAGVSPGIAETLASLGRSSSLRRIERCIELSA
jgi:glutamyl/glutaminyl-tRNA synthetase